ncbi:hypothetical protein [Pseudomonas sp. KCJK9016]|uniref:hypothetical protein n=1 Tax=Pseudomonas sp. KCJK9016 TaxID=3344556 RepID=UPI00390699FD
MDTDSNKTAGPIVSFEAEDETWPLSRVKGTIKDDRDGTIYMFTERTFRGWYSGRPLLGKRVIFFAILGPSGHIADDVELE